MKESKYYKRKYGNKFNYNWLSKLLLSIIILLISLIVCNFDTDLRDSFSKNVLEDNINFSFFNKYYKKFMSKEDSDTMEVGNVSLNEEREYVDGTYKIKYGVDAPIYVLAPGIIVFDGTKDGLSNTVIVQGNDGVDIWYSGVSLNEYGLYDYVSEGDVLGGSILEYGFVSIVKDGKLKKIETIEMLSAELTKMIENNDNTSKKETKKTVPMEDKGFN